MASHASKKTAIGTIDREKLWKLVAETEREIVELERNLSELTRMQSEDTAERRTHRRWDIDCPVRICFHDGSDDLAQLQDISFGGLRLQLDRNLQPSDMVAVLVKEGDFSEVRLEGQVRWISAVSGRYVAGIHFDGLTLDARTFISRLIASKSNVTMLELSSHLS